MNNALSLNPPFAIRRGFALKWKSAFLRVFMVLNIISILVLLVFYIFQVNAEVSERYLIQRHEARLVGISEENKNLEINSAHASSLDNIIGLLEGLNYEKTDKIHYIRVLGNQVVAK